jgi:hypothetical protein
VTKFKRQARKAAGLSAFDRWTNPSRIKQRGKYRLGLYSPTMRTIRQTSKGKFPSLFGLFSNIFKK